MNLTTVGGVVNETNQHWANISYPQLQWEIVLENNKENTVVYLF